MKQYSVGVNVRVGDSGIGGYPDCIDLGIPDPNNA